jgi:hypothetical protein
MSTDGTSGESSGRLEIVAGLIQHHTGTSECPGTDQISHFVNEGANV